MTMGEKQTYTLCMFQTCNHRSKNYKHNFITAMLIMGSTKWKSISCKMSVALHNDALWLLYDVPALLSVATCIFKKVAMDSKS